MRPESAPRQGKAADKESVTLAIVTYNRERQILGALQRAFRFRPEPREILVVDQTPRYSPEALRFLARAQDRGRIRWVRQFPANLPLARGRAVREAKGDILLFLDDDVTAPPDIVGRHRANYRDSAVDAVAGRVRQEDRSLFVERGDPRLWPRLMDPFYFSMNGRRRVAGIAACWTCNFSARLRVLRGIGEFDGNYVGFARGEDVDIALRIWKNGGRIVFDPLARVDHSPAPKGGTRVQTRWRFRDEWLVSFSSSYFAFRYYFPTLFFWYLTFWGNVRDLACRAENRRHPWRLPWALLAYAYAWIRAAWKARRRRRSHFFPGHDRGFEELAAYCRRRALGAAAEKLRLSRPVMD